MKAADLPPGLLLQATGLGKSFGGIEAVADVSFAIKAGELLALIGPNGAGKSTLFNLLSGQLRADRGSAQLVMNPAASVKVATVELTGKSPQAISRLGVGRTFQVAQTFASLTVLENVQIALLAADGLHFSLLRPAKKHRIPDALALLANVGLQAQAARICGEMAYGDIKRIELAIALAGKPRLLLMDEPTAGMSSAERQALMALVRRIAKGNNMGVLFTEHSMDVVFASSPPSLCSGEPAGLRPAPRERKPGTRFARDIPPFSAPGACEEGNGNRLEKKSAFGLQGTGTSTLA